MNMLMRKKQGNISILVMFVLLASSLLGVLALHFIQNMTEQSVLTYQYYQSYYLAKAGVELQLAALPSRGYGFSRSLASGSRFLQDNFLCHGKCDLWTSIQGSSSLLSDSVWDTT